MIRICIRGQKCLTADSIERNNALSTVVVHRNTPALLRIVKTKDTAQEGVLDIEWWLSCIFIYRTFVRSRSNQQHNFSQLK